jgi:predicted small lipoprotein YifL
LIQEFAVNFSIDRKLIRIVTIGALAGAFGLAGCGRKGPLDPPPSASVAETAPAAAPGPGAVSMNPMAPPAKQTPEAFGLNGEPIAPKGPKKPIALDWLLN